MRFWRTLPPFARMWPHGRLGVTSAILTGLALVALLLSGIGGIFAASAPPSTHARDPRSHQIRLHGVKPRALNGLNMAGKEDEARLLHLSIALRLAHPLTLSELLVYQQTRGSAQYHQYLTPQSFTDQYAPSASDVAAVRAFLQQHGLKVTAIAANRLFVNTEGTVAQVEQAFGVSIVQYQLGKRLVFAPEQDPIIPDTLAATVLSIGGLDDVAAAHPNLTVKGSTAHAIAGSGTTSGASPLVVNPSPVGGFTPTNLRTAYDVSTLITNGGTGASQRVAVFELAPYIPSDITTYRTQYGLPNSPINNISVDGAKVTCTSGANCDVLGVVESDLDIEVLSALAPNATLDVYAGPNTSPYTSYINDTYNAIVTRNVDKVVTTSWGVCEPGSGTSELQVLDTIFAEAAAQGQTIFAAAGDNGSDDCRSNPQTPPSVDSPASDPYVMGVGGTALTLSATGGYGSESVWNSHDSTSAGGGGLSGYFAKPTWQVGGGVTNSYASGQREVPDVAAEAEINTGYSIYCTSATPQCSWQGSPSGWMTLGGTGGAAPLWAAITADINSYLIGKGFAPFGWANPTFYTLFTGAQVAPAFRDITVGNNDSNYGNTAYAGDYPATTCFDLTTGMGSPDVWNMASDMAGQLKNDNSGSCHSPEAPLQLVSDGSFESYSNTPWLEYSIGGYAVADLPGDPHSGARSAIECGYPGCDDRVWQTVHLPATVSTARLTFWEDTYTDLTRLGTGKQQCLDHFYVTLGKADGTVIDNVMSSCATNTNGYVYRTFDVTNALKPYQGQEIQVMFRSTTANISVLPVDSSIWSVDDVSLAAG